MTYQSRKQLVRIKKAKEMNAPIAISVETPLNRPFPGTKLDVPRLAAPRGRARGAARANLPGRSYRMFVYHSSVHALAHACACAWSVDDGYKPRTASGASATPRGQNRPKKGGAVVLWMSPRPPQSLVMSG